MKNYISSDNCNTFCGKRNSHEKITNSDHTEGEQDTDWYSNSIKDSSAMFEYHEIESEINKITDKIEKNDNSVLNTSNNSHDQSVDSFIYTDSRIWKKEEKPEQTPQDFTDEFLHLIIKKRATSKAFQSKFLFPGERLITFKNREESIHSVPFQDIHTKFEDKTAKDAAESQVACEDVDNPEIYQKTFRLNINSKAFSPSNALKPTFNTSTPKRKSKKNIITNPPDASKQSFKEKMKFRQVKKPAIEDNSKLIHIDNIIKGKDKRTTLMIRHIPNKYNIVSMLEDINVEFKDKYDLFYLPLDFVNNCNLGYAFINFVDSFHIIQFYETFRGKKWRRFKSEKICELAYAKFQGKRELIAHFEKGSVMNFDSEDKKPLILPTPNPLPNVEIPLKYYNDFTEAYPWAQYEIFRDRIIVHTFYGF